MRKIDAKLLILCLVSSFPCVAQNVVVNPLDTQSIVQPSTATHAETTFNANVLEQVRYADQFAWSQTSTGAGTIVIGSNTITINAIRGINGFSAPPGTGYGTYHTTHKIRISGTGTPEVVTISGTTCTGVSTGTCTITFTATGNHGAGYTVGTATGGYQEALVDAVYTGAGTNPVTGFQILGSPVNSLAAVPIFYGTFAIDNVAGSTSPIVIDCQGATLQSFVSGGPLIQIGTQGNVNNPASIVRIANCNFVPAVGLGRTANGSTSFVYDTTQSMKFEYNTFGFINSSDFVDYLVKIDRDESFTYEHNKVNTGNGPPMKCDATFCGSALFITDTVGQGGPGIVRDNDFTMQCTGNAIDMQGGNGLTYSNNIIQNYSQFGVRYWQKAGYQFSNDMGGNYFEEGSCTNPDFGTLTNFQGDTEIIGGSQWVTSGIQHGGSNPHQFGSGTAHIYALYIVATQVTSGRKSTPLFIGTAGTPPHAVSIPVQWLPIADASSCDLIASDVTNGGSANSTTAPFGTGSWAIATGLNCNGTPNVQTVTTSATGIINLTNYPVDSGTTNWWSPVIPYWPVPVFLGSNLEETIPNADGIPVHYGTGRGAVVVSALPVAGSIYYGEVLTDVGAPANTTSSGFWPMLIRKYRPVTENTNGGSSGSHLINPNDEGSGQSLMLLKGKYNFASTTWSGSDACNVTFWNQTPASVFANGVNRPALESQDSCVGYDHDPSYMSFMNNTAISFYIGGLMDDMNWKERLTAALKTFNVNVSIPSNTLQVGGGTAITAFNLYATASITPSGVLGQTCSDQTFTVAGLTTSDRLSNVTPPNTLGNVSLNAYVNATNKVLLHFCNPATMSTTPPSGIYSFFAVH